MEQSETIEDALQISVDAIGFITLAKCVAKKWEIAECHILAVTITVGSVRGEENFRTVVVLLAS